jgi:hypothetical protein
MTPLQPSPQLRTTASADLKPESLISHSGFDALERFFLLSHLDWLRYEHEHWLGSLLAIALLPPSRQCLAGDDDGAGLLWQRLYAVQLGQ